MADRTHVRTRADYAHTTFVTDTYSHKNCRMGNQGRMDTEALPLEVLNSLKRSLPPKAA